MELLVLLLVAIAGGYLLANSRLSKPIDRTGEKVTQTTRDMADRAEGVWTRTFRRNKPSEQVIEGTAVEAAVAEKQASRRREEE